MVVKAGEWGGDGGVNPWKFVLEDHCKITSITVSSDSWYVYSITFNYKDKDNVEHSETHGAKGGREGTFTLAKREYLCGFGGSYGDVITSLSFQGSKDSDATFGTRQGTHFSLPLAEGKFVGFYGNFGTYLDSIGAILSPEN